MDPDSDEFLLVDRDSLATTCAPSARPGAKLALSTPQVTTTKTFAVPKPLPFTPSLSTNVLSSGARPPNSETNSAATVAPPAISQSQPLPTLAAADSAIASPVMAPPPEDRYSLATVDSVTSLWSLRGAPDASGLPLLTALAHNRHAKGALSVPALRVVLTGYAPQHAATSEAVLNKLGEVWSHAVLADGDPKPALPMPPAAPLLLPERVYPVTGTKLGESQPSLMAVGPLPKPMVYALPLTVTHPDQYGYGLQDNAPSPFVTAAAHRLLHELARQNHQFYHQSYEQVLDPLRRNPLLTTPGWLPGGFKVDERDEADDGSLPLDSDHLPGTTLNLVVYHLDERYIDHQVVDLHALVQYLPVLPLLPLDADEPSEIGPGTKHQAIVDALKFNQLLPYVVRPWIGGRPSERTLWTMRALAATDSQLLYDQLLDHLEQLRRLPEAPRPWLTQWVTLARDCTAAIVQRLVRWGLGLFVMLWLLSLVSVPPAALDDATVAIPTVRRDEHRPMVSHWPLTPSHWPSLDGVVVSPVHSTVEAWGCQPLPEEPTRALCSYKITLRDHDRRVWAVPRPAPDAQEAGAKQCAAMEPLVTAWLGTVGQYPVGSAVPLDAHPNGVGPGPIKRWILDCHHFWDRSAAYTPCVLEVGVTTPAQSVHPAHWPLLQVRLATNNSQVQGSPAVVSPLSEYSRVRAASSSCAPAWRTETSPAVTSTPVSKPRHSVSSQPAWTLATVQDAMAQAARWTQDQTHQLVARAASLALVARAQTHVAQWARWLSDTLHPYWQRTVATMYRVSTQLDHSARAFVAQRLRTFRTKSQQLIFQSHRMRRTVETQLGRGRQWAKARWQNWKQAMGLARSS
ncbi:hypothetical protein H4R35_003864 [Dimargaris xerosporica]|nr:hypothetical protein H4R35_003864 [Dimargaris xerosporica]